MLNFLFKQTFVLWALVHETKIFDLFLLCLPHLDVKKQNGQGRLPLKRREQRQTRDLVGNEIRNNLYLYCEPQRHFNGDLQRSEKTRVTRPCPGGHSRGPQTVLGFTVVVGKWVVPGQHPLLFPTSMARSQAPKRLFLCGEGEKYSRAVRRLKVFTTMSVLKQNTFVFQNIPYRMQLRALSE